MPDWSGETVGIVASGPSLSPDRVGLLAGRCRVIAVNDAWRLAPFADALYAADAAWWEHHDGVPEFSGMRWTQLGPYGNRPADLKTAERYGLSWWESLPNPGLSLTPGTIHQGGNSGYQALNLAVLMGAERIVLLGFDMKPGADGRRHWFGEHPGALRKDSPYRDWIENFRTTLPDLEKSGVEVINCTPGSALDCFPIADLKDVLS
jgi:hypothetical protein